MSKSKKAIAVIMLLVAVLFRIEPVVAEDKQMSSQERLQQFEIFVNCEPVYLTVEGFHNMPHAEKIGLTKTAIINAVESRLRSARVYTNDPANPYQLYINVTVLRSAFSVYIAFHKMLYDFRNRLDGFATTWYRGTTGIHGGQDGGYILSSVSSLIDEFLVEYFRVNEKACEQK